MCKMQDNFLFVNEIKMTITNDDELYNVLHVACSRHYESLAN